MKKRITCNGASFISYFIDKKKKEYLNILKYNIELGHRKGKGRGLGKKAARYFAENLTHIFQYLFCQKYSNLEQNKQLRDHL